MVVHLLHGFNVRDGGKGTVRQWADTLRQGGHKVIVHDLGLIGLVDLRCRTTHLVRELKPLIQKDHAIVGHSHGTVIAHALVKDGVRPRAVVCVNSALRRDARWPDSLPVLNLYSSKDAVLILARVWSRLSGRGHQWGAAGRFGFSAGSGKQVFNMDMAETWWEHPAHGHSAAFKGKAGEYWGRHVSQWLSFVGQT